MDWWIWVLVAVVVYVLCAILGAWRVRRIAYKHDYNKWLQCQYVTLNIFTVPLSLVLSVYSAYNSKRDDAQREADRQSEEKEFNARVVQFTSVFGFAPNWNGDQYHEKVAWEEALVNEELRRRAVAMQMAFKMQERTRENESSPEAIAINGVVALRKARFWDEAHFLAKAFGFTVCQKFLDYLPVPGRKTAEEE